MSKYLFVLCNYRLDFHPQSVLNILTKIAFIKVPLICMYKYAKYIFIKNLLSEKKL